jgi:hypothetical protein
VTPERSPFVENYLNKRRLAYEKSGNVVAVLEALPLTCPDWLVRALYSIIAAEIDEGVGMVGRWSAQHRRELVDFMRARAMAIARAHGATWAEAREYSAEYFASTPADSAGSSVVMKRSHRRAQPEPTGLEVTLPSTEFLPTKAIQRVVWRALEARLKKAGRWVDSPAADPRLRPRIDDPKRVVQKKFKGKKIPVVRASESL